MKREQAKKNKKKRKESIGRRMRSKDECCRGSGDRCDRALWGEGSSSDTPATHSELRNEPRQGCSYTVERDRGGCSVCPTKMSTFPQKRQIRRPIMEPLFVN